MPTPISNAATLFAAALATTLMTASPRAQDKPSALPEGALSLRRTKLTDAEMGGAVSHTLLVPDGWTVDARAFWTGNPNTIVEFCGGVTGPEGEEISFFPTTFASYTDNAMVVQNMGGVREGRLANGTPFVAAPSGPGEAVKTLLLPTFRPKATNVRVLHTEPIEEVNRMLAEVMAPVIQQTEQNNRMMQQMGGSQVQHWYVAERAVVRYEEDGQAYEEEFHIAQMGMTTRVPELGLGGPPMLTQDWRVLPFRSGRAKAGALQSKMPLLTTISMSVQETPKWHNAVQQIRMQVSRMQHRDRMAQIKAMGDASKKIAQTYSDISDMRHDSWKKQQADNARSQRAFTNAIAGIDDYRLPGGDTVSLSNEFKHVYTDGNDRFVFTDNPNLELGTTPGFSDVDWQAIRPVRPSGGAGN